ncbi:MAG: cyclic pyranopterin monophosphate synthase MoaC [Deltaproteobacteria bacterium]|nr:cyclic pyranopterin monophosphate synthase MoaC [Deltaproteobacteria bacterium]
MPKRGKHPVKTSSKKRASGAARPRKEATRPRVLLREDLELALPHLDPRGFARMVDVGAKPSTHRVAVAEAFVRMKPETLRLLEQGALEKGDAFSVARIAGIAASKRTADLIPLAHPVALTHAAVELTPEPEHGRVRVETRVETTGVTGVELEALVAAATAALAIYDMAKARDRGMVIEGLRLVMKSGGRSGMYLQPSTS